MTIICPCGRSLLVSSAHVAVMTWGWTLTDVTADPATGLCHECREQAPLYPDMVTILSHREQRFVAAIRAGQSGIDAARLSGYLEPAADAERLLASEKIKAALATVGERR